MEQVDLTRALPRLKEMSFCRWLAARKELLHEQRLSEAGGALLAPTSRRSASVSLFTSSGISGCAIAPCTAFPQPQALG